MNTRAAVLFLAVGTACGSSPKTVSNVKQTTVAPPVETPSSIVTVKEEPKVVDPGHDARPRDHLAR